MLHPRFKPQEALVCAMTAAPYGCDALVDYRDADWAQKVRQLTGGAGTSFGVDCISERGTVAAVCSVLSDDGKYVVFRAPAGVTTAWMD